MVTNERRKGGVLTVNAASEEIGVHHVTLYRWLEAGKVACVEFGGIFFVPIAEVERIKLERGRKAKA